MRNVWIILAALLSLSACGLKGALYLPPKPPAQAPATVTPDANPPAQGSSTTALPPSASPAPTSSPYPSLPVTP